MKELAFSDTAQCFETLSGAQVIVRRPDDATLAPAMEAGPTLREVVWGVDSEESLDLLAKSLPGAIEYWGSSYDNHSELKPEQGENAPLNADTPHRPIAALDPHGLRIVFQRSCQRSVAIQGATTNPYGNAQRISSRRKNHEQHHPHLRSRARGRPALAQPPPSPPARRYPL